MFFYFFKAVIVVICHLVPGLEQGWVRTSGIVQSEAGPRETWQVFWLPGECSEATAVSRIFSSLRMGLLSLKELTLAQNLQLRGLGKSRHVGWAQDETFLNLKTSFVTNALSPLGSFSLKKKLIIRCYHDAIPVVIVMLNLEQFFNLVMVTSSQMESLTVAFSACLNFDTSRASPACA